MQIPEGTKRTSPFLNSVAIGDQEMREQEEDICRGNDSKVSLEWQRRGRVQEYYRGNDASYTKKDKESK